MPLDKFSQGCWHSAARHHTHPIPQDPSSPFTPGSPPSLSVHPSALQGVERADDGAEHFVRVYESIARQCNVPSRISGVGIRGDDVASLAEQSQLQTRLLVNNPVAVDEDTARLLYVAVL